MSTAPKATDVEAGLPGLPRTVTIDVAHVNRVGTGAGMPRTMSRTMSRQLSRQSSLGGAPATRLPIEYRTLSQHVQDRDDLRVDGGRKDKDKRKAVKGSQPRLPLMFLCTADTVTDLASLDWHKVSVAEVLQRLSVSPEVGLDATQVARRVAQYGKNQITPPKDNTLLKVLGWIFGGFGTLLLGASIVCFIAWYNSSPVVMPCPFAERRAGSRSASRPHRRPTSHSQSSSSSSFSSRLSSTRGRISRPAASSTRSRTCSRPTSSSCATARRSSSPRPRSSPATSCTSASDRRSRPTCASSRSAATSSSTGACSRARYGYLCWHRFWLLMREQSEAISGKVDKTDDNFLEVRQPDWYECSR
jgi:hypothetical protein